MKQLFPVFILGFLSGLAAAAYIGWQQQPTGTHAAYMRDEYGYLKREIWIDRLEAKLVRPI